MSNDNGNGNLRNGMILNLDQRMDQVLQGIGTIQAKIEQLQQDGENRSEDLAKIERKLVKMNKQTNERLDQHIADHCDNPEVMGLVPALRKYLKRHWRILLLAWALAQIGIAGLMLKYGVTKLISTLLG